MSKKKLGIIIIIIILVGFSGFFYFLQNTPHNSQNSQIINFANLSAKEALNPLAGRVNSQENSLANQNSTLPEICQGAKAENFSCYAKYYQDLTKTQGVAAAFVDLRARYNKNDYIIEQCHPLAHIIGNKAIEIYPSVTEAYNHGDSFCWSGYYHGVLEELIFREGKDKILSRINKLCEDVHGKTSHSFDYYNCVHGIGHGIMALTEDQVFDSLKISDSLEGEWEQNACYGGVFMENIIADGGDHATNFLKPEDPFYPCNAVEQKYKKFCYLIQTSYVAKITDTNFAKIFSACETVEAGYTDICFQSLGRDIAGNSLNDAQKTKEGCQLGKDFYQQSNCLIGASIEFVAYFNSDVQARGLCNLFSNDLQKLCLSTVNNFAYANGIISFFDFIKPVFLKMVYFLLFIVMLAIFI